MVLTINKRGKEEKCLNCEGPIPKFKEKYCCTRCRNKYHWKTNKKHLQEYQRRWWDDLKERDRDRYNYLMRERKRKKRNRKEGRMGFSYYIDREIHLELKKYCKLTGVSISSVVEKMMRRRAARLRKKLKEEN